MKFRYLFVLLLLGSPLLTTARAQAPDSTAAPPLPKRALLAINLGALGTMASSPNISNTWDPGMSLAFSSSLLLERVFLEGGLSLHSYSSRNLGIPGELFVPDFSATHVFLGGGYVRPISADVSLHVGAQIGTFRMTFDEDTFAGVRTESELTFTPYVRARFAINRAISLFTGISYTRVYTADRFSLGFFTMGISYARAAPNWVVSFLR